MCLQGTFFQLANQSEAPQSWVEPEISEYQRMVYLALSQVFFDSGLLAYYRAGVFEMNIANEKVTTPPDSEVHHRDPDRPRPATRYPEAR